MNDVQDPKTPACLAVNGVLLIFVALLLGPAIPMVPYPRLMLSAHTILIGVGTLSLLAAVLVKTGLVTLGKKTGGFVLFAHVFEWVLCFAQIAGAVWGTNKALPIAAGQAGAPGGLPWQENAVLICQLIPSIFLLIAWGLLLWSVLTALPEALKKKAAIFIVAVILAGAALAALLVKTVPAHPQAAAERSFAPAGSTLPPPPPDSDPIRSADVQWAMGLEGKITREGYQPTPAEITRYQAIAEKLQEDMVWRNPGR